MHYSHGLQHSAHRQPGADQREAQEAFASDAGYRNWAAMVEQAIEVSGSDNVEIREVMENGRLSGQIEAV